MIKKDLENIASIFNKEKEEADKMLTDDHLQSEESELRIQLQNITDTTSKIAALKEAFMQIFPQAQGDASGAVVDAQGAVADASGAVVDARDKSPDLTPLPSVPSSAVDTMSPDYRPMPGDGAMSPDYGPMPGDGAMPPGYDPMPGDGAMPPGYDPMLGDGAMPPGYDPMLGDGAMPPGYGNMPDTSMYERGGSRRLARRRKRRSVRRLRR